MTEFKHNNITLLNCDCMEYMATIPDKYFELAIVDPPYGIGDWTTGQSVTKKNGKKIVKENGKWKNVYWNNEIPNINYFNEVIRVSKNQIIWGANYYNCFNKLGGSLIWHKGNINPVFSQCEIASLSFQKKVDYVHINWQAGFARNKEGDTIHPCQKPAFAVVNAGGEQSLTNAPVGSISLRQREGQCAMAQVELLQVPLYQPNSVVLIVALHYILYKPKYSFYQPLGSLGSSEECSRFLLSLVFAVF